jgi:hypothetical protein
MLEIRFDKTKDEVALLIWFLVDHSVYLIIDQWRLVTFLAGWADILMLLLHFLLCLL